MERGASYQALIERVDTALQVEESIDMKPIIAVWGLMNAGKSYLLNMLTDHLDEDYFKTNDIRETAEIKVYEDNDFIFIDTPGLDANEADDLEAHKGVKEADIVLFVHQPQGALEKNEIEFLSMLKKRYGEYADSSIIIVLSKIDREPPEKIALIRQEILRQCEEIIGISPQCFSVSGTRYKRGMIDHNEKFVTASQVDRLKDHLLSSSHDVLMIRNYKRRVDVVQLIEEAVKSLLDLFEKRAAINAELHRSFQPFNDHIDQFQDWLERKSREAREIYREIP